MKRGAAREGMVASQLSRRSHTGSHQNGGMIAQNTDSRGELTANVSVVIPTYNDPHFLVYAIRSVQAQTYRDFEIIVVDDGSTGETKAVVSEFGGDLRYIRQENLGAAAARNTGILAARGKYVAFLDSDDLWLPTYLESMFSMVSQYPDAGVIYSCARYIDENGRELPQLVSLQKVTPDATRATLLRANFLIPSAIMVRRDVVLTAGLFDERLGSHCPDWDLWLRLARTQTFVHHPHCLVRYRLHDGSLSVDIAGMHRGALMVIEKHFGPDDARRDSWSNQKRRAYGALYVYQALTTLLHRKLWEHCALYLRNALQCDRSLVTDLDLFYELALGTQPLGHRGTGFQLNLEENATALKRVLVDVFGPLAGAEWQSLRQRALGTAYYALGLVAYNTGRRAPSRRFLLEALRYQPRYWRDRRVLGTMARSLVSGSALDRMKRARDFVTQACA